MGDLQEKHQVLLKMVEQQGREVRGFIERMKHILEIYQTSDENNPVDAQVHPFGPNVSIRKNPLFDRQVAEGVNPLDHQIDFVPPNQQRMPQIPHHPVIPMQAVIGNPEKAVEENLWYDGVGNHGLGKKLQEKLDKLESVIRKTQGSDDYHIDLEGLFDTPQVTLPPKFEMPDMEKFNGTGNPKNHLKMYVNTLRPMGLNDDQLAILFHRTLTDGASRWFLALKPSQIRTWGDVATLFSKQYEYNTQIDVTVRDLETTRQDTRESFAGFITRWRNKAAKMANRPNEKEQIRMILKNLMPYYHEKMYLMPIFTFDQLLDVGIKVEDLAREEKLRKEEANRGCEVVTSSPQQSYNHDSPTINAIRAKPQSPSRKPIDHKSRRRVFADLGMSLSTALQKLIKSGHLKPLTPLPPPNPLPANYDSTKFCAFHQNRGHETNNCIRLRHEIQDLIQNGVIATPHPLPNHHAVPPPNHINFISLSKPVNLTQFIIPISQPKPTVLIGEEVSIMLLNADDEDQLPEELFSDEDEGLFSDDVWEELFYLEELDLGLDGIQWWESENSRNETWLGVMDWIEHLDHASMN